MSDRPSYEDIRFLWEHGPAMNEHEAWANMKNYLNNFGMATRLENAAATSVPDVIFMCRNMIMFIELKVDYGGTVYTSPYQNAYGTQARHHIKAHQHWVAVWVDDGFHMFTFQRFKTMPSEAWHGKLKVQWEPIWEKMPKKFHLTSFGSYEEWINTLYNLEFGE